MNEVLRRAMYDAQLTEADLAAKLAVDPKTVRKWLRDQMPHPHSRTALSRLLGVDDRVIWPALSVLGPAKDQSAELVAVYPRRMSIDQQGWLSLFGSAEAEIGILAYSAIFLAENARLIRLLGEKAIQGVTVRIALGDPEGRNVDRRGVEEEIGEAMSTKIRSSLVFLEPLLQQDGVQVGLHDTVLYNSMYRSDDQLLVNQHAFGIPAAQSPVYHFRRGGDGSEMFDAYLASFERVWSLARSTATGVDRM